MLWYTAPWTMILPWGENQFGRRKRLHQRKWIPLRLSFHNVGMTTGISVLSWKSCSSPMYNLSFLKRGLRSAFLGSMPLTAFCKIVTGSFYSLFKKKESQHETTIERAPHLVLNMASQPIVFHFNSKSPLDQYEIRHEIENFLLLIPATAFWLQFLSILQDIPCGACKCSDPISYL